MILLVLITVAIVVGLLAVVIPVIIIPLRIIKVIMTRLNDRIIPFGLQGIDLIPAFPMRKRLVLFDIFYPCFIIGFDIAYLEFELVGHSPIPIIIGRESTIRPIRIPITIRIAQGVAKTDPNAYIGARIKAPAIITTASKAMAESLGRSAIGDAQRQQ